MGLPVLLTLENRKAVCVGPDPAREDRVAVEQQMVGGDRGPDVLGSSFHELCGLGGGDVFEHDAQLGQAVD